MTREDIIHAFYNLGSKLATLRDPEMDDLSLTAQAQNRWFTPLSVKHAIDGIGHMLEKPKLEHWLDQYPANPGLPKMIGLVLAGNIPLVGFHDILCVLLSGHVAVIKPSKDDHHLIKKVLNWLVELEPRLNKNIIWQDKLTNIDAVIATGSDNTSRYFEYYFRKYPNIIRKNRVSVGILKGNESNEQLKALSDDIFQYFGLGCRNISKLFIPDSYELPELMPCFSSHENIISHSKYLNNYEYNKSIYLVNKEPHLDSGYFLMRETLDLVSPVSVIFYERYKDISEVEENLERNSEKIQCVVGEGGVPFGQAQKPELWDYADNIDTMSFLLNLA